MSSLALALVLVSAVAHATWNLIAKRVGGGLGFQWLFTALSAALYAPLALSLVALNGWRWTPTDLLFIAGTALLHVVYFLLLIRGYALGDLSVVYPLARGTGPLLATAAAIAIFRERPTALALAGTLLIALGIVLLLGNPLALRRSGNSRAGMAVLFALLTGVLIATYTLWDKQAVSTARVPVTLYYWSSLALQTLLLTPVALLGPARRVVGKTVRAHWRAALGVAVLSPLSYFLVLTAFTMAPVSYVAPSREIGILLGAVMGSHFLEEGHLGRRLLAAAMMVLGVAALALG